MPVKVSCPGCEKVLNAPEAARGKAVKCPDCGSKVPVPAAKAGGGAVKKKKVVDDDDFLNNLDLDRVEDQTARICPRCGTDVLDETATECPKCHVDLRTGQLSAKRKKRLQSVGPDPDEFFEVVWKDSYKFLIDNKMLCVQTGLVLTILLALQMLIAWVASKVTGGPPLIFLTAFSFLVAIGGPGWYMQLTLAIVRNTMERRKSMETVHIDLPYQMMLGLTYLTWLLIFYLPAFVVAVPLFLVNPLLAVLSFFAIYPLIGIFSPLAWTHFATPVTWRAYWLPAAIGSFFKIPRQTIVWWLTFIVGNLLGVVFLCITLYAAWTAFFYLVNLGFFAVKAAADAGALPASKPTITAIQYAILAGVLLGILTLAFICYTAAAVGLLYSGRALGHLANLCRNELGLITQVIEKDYVRKEVKLDKFGNPVVTPAQRVMQAAVVIITLLVVAGAGYFVLRSLGVLGS